MLAFSCRVIKERRNGQGAEVAGVTVEGKVAYLSLVQLQAGVTWQKSHYTRPEKWSKDSSVPAEKRIFRTPDWYGYFTATYSPVKPLNIALSGTYTGSLIEISLISVKNILNASIQLQSDEFIQRKIIGYFQVHIKEVGSSYSHIFRYVTFHVLNDHRTGISSSLCN